MLNPPLEKLVCRWEKVIVNWKKNMTPPSFMMPNVPLVQKSPEATAPPRKNFSEMQKNTLKLACPRPKYYCHCL
jgi:hypothetical protein